MMSLHIATDLLSGVLDDYIWPPETAAGLSADELLLK